MLALSEGEPTERSDYVVGLLAILVAELNDQLDVLVAQAVNR